MFRWMFLVVLAPALLLVAPARAERSKDLADIHGVRGNPLWAYGLVVGLNGTGDNSPVSRRALTNVLRRSGLVLNPDDLSSKNIASVIVTADLPAFARNGSSIDVTVSAIGSTISLQGGTLLLTPLTGADGQVYAVAQGALSVGGFAAGGESASVSKNHPTVGRIPNGATVEKEELATFVERGHIRLLLRSPDFTTSQRVAKAVNEAFPNSAQAVDAGTIQVQIPPKTAQNELLAFLDRLCSLEVQVDAPAVVVINERTGTVIVGEKVTISAVAISHGSLSIVTQEKDYVSQPPPFARSGTTEKVHRTEISAGEQKANLILVPRASVADLAKALNAMGTTPRDIIAIFQALSQAGALQAQLKIM